MTTQEHAKAIRAEFKKRGWGARQVSVRCHLYSLGSSIYVTVRDASVGPLSRVEQIAKTHEHVRYDQFGEILGGGNMFVRVEYSTEAREVLARRHWDAVEQALHRAENLPEGSLENVGELDWSVRLGEGYFDLWRDGTYVRRCYDVRDAAVTIGLNEGAQ